MSKDNIKITLVSSFLKNECGIASYTQDLLTSLRHSAANLESDVIAVKTLPKNYSRSTRIKLLINPESLESYRKAVVQINSSNCDIVHIQHEFGLYGGDEGINVLNLIENINKKIVITFHTVLSEPSEEKFKIVKKISTKAEHIIVMAKIAKNTLITRYGVSPDKISEIPHGVPEISNLSSLKAKERLNLLDYKVISTFGLINRGKGIEYIIEALAKVKDEIPKILFLVLGKTHPKVVLKEGESYRKYLQDLTRQFQLEQNVRFVDRYLSQEELLTYLKATDIYVTTYLEPQQAASGTLAYALGAGKPCISTPYIYAKEMLSDDKGILVPFRESQAIAESISKLFSNDRYMQAISDRAYQFSRKMTWANVGKAHLDLYYSLKLQKDEITPKTP